MPVELTSYQIELIKDFVESNLEYPNSVSQQILTQRDSIGEYGVVIDLREALGEGLFPPQLTELFYEHPQEFIDQMGVFIANILSRNVDSTTPIVLSVHLRNICTKNNRSNFLSIKKLYNPKVKGRLVHTEGVVKSMTYNMSRVVSALWRCKICGTEIANRQNSFNLRKPTQDDLGHENYYPFPVSKVENPITILEIEELPENDDENNSTISVFVDGNTHNLLNRNQISLGSRVKLTAFVGNTPEWAIKPEEAIKSIQKSVLNANYIELLDDEIISTTITAQEEEKIREIASDPNVFEILTNSVAPQLEGMQNIKEAVMYALFGGVRRIGKFNARGIINILLVSDPAKGKCLGKGTEIVMYDGLVKKVEDVNVGDLLMGDDSTPRKVLSLARGRAEMRKITPFYGGQPFICNKDHILTLQKSGARFNWEIVDTTLAGLEKLPNKERYKLIRTGVEFPLRPDPILNPYFVGIWLGDGNNDDQSICKPDHEIKNFLEQMASEYKLRMSIYYNTKKCPRYQIVGKKNHPNPIKDQLKSLNLLHNKHIPNDYKCGSRNVRLQILAGLLDTDGYLDPANTSFEIATKYPQLAKDILFIARSLGFGATTRKKRVTLKKYGFVGEYSVLKISGDLTTIPTLISRKVAKPYNRNRRCNISGFKIENLPPDEYYGFILTGNGRFLLSDFTITHNSSLFESIRKIAPKCKKVLGGATSKAGLGAGATRSEITGKFSIEAGALVMANKGVLLMDEMDKFEPEDMASLHESMESCTITKSIVGQNRSFNAETTIIGACNPEHSRFDAYKSVTSQIKLAPSLISRFDGVFAMRDIPNAVEDKAILTRIYQNYSLPENIKPPVAPELFRKYITLAKRINPSFSHNIDVQNALADFYVGMRTTSVVNQGGNTIPITTRQAESILRFAEASARIRLSHSVEKEDIQRGINVIMGYLKEFGFDQATGRFDIDRVVSDLSSTGRNLARTILAVLSDRQLHTYEEILARTREQLPTLVELDFEEMVSKLTRKGEFTESKRGQYQLV